ncbi:MAG: hypothetical protein GC185_07600 [Alphaproteobacteria bacterium]|nr:hypothetical protein [Alphaproteobacteria bacterium]
MTEKKKKPAGKPVRRRKKTDLRETINVLAIIEALEQHVLGEKEMSSTQVSAALALLKKTLPDIAEPKRGNAAEPATAHEDALSGLE